MARGGTMLIPILAVALLAGCGSGGGETVGGVTADEAAQLNNAAEMLDASADGLAVPEGAEIEAESKSGDSSGAANAD